MPGGHPGFLRTFYIILLHNKKGTQHLGQDSAREGRAHLQLELSREPGGERVIKSSTSQSTAWEGTWCSAEGLIGTWWIGILPSITVGTILFLMQLHIPTTSIHCLFTELSKTPRTKAARAFTPNLYRTAPDHEVRRNCAGRRASGSGREASGAISPVTRPDGSVPPPPPATAAVTGPAQCRSAARRCAQHPRAGGLEAQPGRGRPGQLHGEGRVGSVCLGNENQPPGNEHSSFGLLRLENTRRRKSRRQESSSWWGRVRPSGSS